MELRGSFDPATHGIEPGMPAETIAFNRMLAEAARTRAAILLPPGRYELSGIEFPDFVHLAGTPGATRLVYSGEVTFIKAVGSGHVRLSGLVIDGANRWLADDAPGLVYLHGVADLSIEDCQVIGSSRNGLWLERCGGRIAGNRVSGAADSGLFAVDNAGLTITGNDVSDCGDGGILVHRWNKGPDNTMVVANRVSRILARSGGTGENGNGINVFRADGVSVTDNHVSQCAFSAIRANAASDVRIADNHCLQSGETAIYSEFGFEGAIVSGNLIDGACNGISVVNFDHGGRLAVVSGNLVRNLSKTGPYDNGETTFGVGIAVEADCSMTGNVIENAPTFAIALGWGPFLRNVVASGNVVRQSPVGCAVTVVEKAGRAILTDNMFDQVGVAIAGFRWAEQVTGELVGEGAAIPANLTLSANVKV